jgi:hypothetical protein
LSLITGETLKEYGIRKIKENNDKDSGFKADYIVFGYTDYFGLFFNLGNSKEKTEIKSNEGSRLTDWHLCKAEEESLMEGRHVKFLLEKNEPIKTGDWVKAIEDGLLIIGEVITVAHNTIQVKTGLHTALTTGIGNCRLLTPEQTKALELD